MQTNSEQLSRQRVGALRRFAVSITLLNVAGHTFLGFEQSWAHPFVAVLTAYAVELLLEVVDSKSKTRPLEFTGSCIKFIDFLLPAHIAGLAVSMLLYANELLAPIAFASATAIASKATFRVSIGRTSRHFLNPSNFGISLTLLLFPYMCIAAPYQFTENLVPLPAYVSSLIPLIIITAGSLLHIKLAKRLPLIISWLIGFVAQATIRSYLSDTPFIAGLIPMTGVAFTLYSFYMIPDPATTPTNTGGQITFGLAVAAVYGLLMMAHVVFGLFFSLTIVCAGRGAWLLAKSWLISQSPQVMPDGAGYVIRHK